MTAPLIDCAACLADAHGIVGVDLAHDHPVLAIVPTYPSESAMRASIESMLWGDEDGLGPMWPILRTFAVLADERFRSHGGRLWCRDDGEHPAWSTTIVRQTQQVSDLVQWMYEHWECGDA